MSHTTGYISQYNHPSFDITVSYRIIWTYVVTVPCIWASQQFMYLKIHFAKAYHISFLYTSECCCIESLFVVPTVVYNATFFLTQDTLFTKMLVKIHLSLKHVSTSLDHLQVTLFSFYVRDVLYCTRRRSYKYVVIYYFYFLMSFFLFGLWDYRHCGHSWPIVPASGDNEDDCGEHDGM
jgi:hypothetical protein